MLFVTDFTGKEHSWHVGEHFPVLPHQAFMIKADLTELMVIHNRIPDLYANNPKLSPLERVHVFHGESAKVIAFSLLHCVISKQEEIR